MVQKYPEGLIDRLRKLEPFEDTDPNGFQYTVTPERIRVTTKHTGSCRCCQFPLDVGILAIQAHCFSGKEGRSVRKPPKMYIHAEDCTEEGFVCTIGFRGKAPDHFVVMKGGQYREGRFERNDAILWNMTSGEQRLGFCVQYLSELSPETKALIAPKHRPRPEKSGRRPGLPGMSLMPDKKYTDRWPQRDKT